MLIRILLISSLCLIYLYFRNHLSGNKFFVRMLAIGILTGGILAVVFPNVSTEVANLIGIGRGADLILYLMTTFLLLTVTMLHIRIQQLNKSLALFAREIAKQTARSANEKQ